MSTLPCEIPECDRLQGEAQGSIKVANDFGQMLDVACCNRESLLTHIGAWSWLRVSLLMSSRLLSAYQNA